VDYAAPPPGEPPIDLAPATLTWSDWPAPRQATRAGVAAVVIVVVVCGVALVDPWLAVLGAAMLGVATSEVLLPSRYRVSPEGVTVRRAFSERTQPWSRFSGWRRDGDRLILVGEGSRPLLRRHRTLVLRGPEHVETAVAAVSAYLPEQP
jgi:hypothetical protein